MVQRYNNLAAHLAFSLQDDKVSLKFIHDILHADDDNDDRVTWKTDDDDYDFSEPEIPPTSAPVATSCNERRRSLPLCSSIASLCSEYSVTTPPPEISTFEQKRRRAAKLTNFFGVSHRDIMDDILDSIESGVAEEGGRGTLNQAQVDVRPYRGFPLILLWWDADFFFLNVPTHFRIYSRKCKPSKPGHDDLHLPLYIPFALLMYHY